DPGTCGDRRAPLSARRERCLHPANRPGREPSLSQRQPSGGLTRVHHVRRNASGEGERMTMVLPVQAVRSRDTGEISVDDFAEFVRAALPGLLRYGHALAGNPHDGADLVQSVLEKVGSRWTSVVRNADDPLAYVRRAMANTHISVW